MKPSPRIGFYLAAVFLMSCFVGQKTGWAQPHRSLPLAGRIDGLGVNIHFTDPQPGEMQMLAAGGVRWVRMDFGWSATERVRGEYDFSAYDRLIAELQKHHLRCLFILDYSNPLYEADRSVATEAGRQAYARWAGAAAKHFQGRGILWEIWNEPNISGFWSPTPDIEQYTAMALAASRAIHHAAPDEAIIGPATSTIDIAFLKGCFDAGLLELWDAVSVHPYRRSGPETAALEYHKLRQLIKQYAPNGKEIPIVSGEWGYSSAWNGFDTKSQGKLLSRQWLTNLSNQIPVSIWYDWHDDGRDEHEPEHHFGSVAHEYHETRNPVYDPKPAYLAAKTLTSTLDGFRFTKRIATGNPDDYALLFTSDTQRCLVLWTVSADAHEIVLPASTCTFDAKSHTGERLEIVSAHSNSLTVTISDSPQFLITSGPNEKLDLAPNARDLRATVTPVLGKVLSVQVANLSDADFQGTVRLVDAEGIEPNRYEQTLDMAADETERAIRFELRTNPTQQYRVGLRIEDQTGQVMFHMPARRFVFLANRLLDNCHVVKDGDPNVPSDFTIEIAAAPQTLSKSDAKVMKIKYDFGDGWKFMRVVPRNPPEIEGKPTGFGFWIYGDSQGTSPRLRVRDSTNQTWQPSGHEIDWTGWRYIEFPLNRDSGHWGGAEDHRVHEPLVWDSLFLLDNPTRKPNRGTIFIASPIVLY
ncbi:hypothetical protein CA13_63110 [Planctomycetes bacterium CA13]|uniref:Glycoside hydrolase family 5 domain-containing protein n=1 Tax=Novipirellula herctigrandis TaxID=2527986 RepID=A0A5C5ZCE4_9BACT|nr:hypothetical protein CA13_63110 [Planctomycetes bacterium CA13]